MVASDLKNYSFWIGKRVNVGTVDDAVLRGKSDEMETLPAYDRTGRMLLGLVAGRGGHLTIWLARFGMPPEQIHAPAFEKWWWLASASRHRYCIHYRLPILVVQAGRIKKTGSRQISSMDDPPVLSIPCHI